MVQPKRHRGGQPGNKNAVRHGYYCKSLNRKKRFDFNVAAYMQGIEEEIALLRFEIKKAVSGGDLKSLVPLSRAIFAREILPDEFARTRPPEVLTNKRIGVKMKLSCHKTKTKIRACPRSIRLKNIFLSKITKRIQREVWSFGDSQGRRGGFQTRLINPPPFLKGDTGGFDK